MGGTCLEPPPVVRLLPLLVTILHPRRSLRRDSRGGFLPWQCSRREALVDVRDNALLGSLEPREDGIDAAVHALDAPPKLLQPIFETRRAQRESLRVQAREKTCLHRASVAIGSGPAVRVISG